MKPWSLIPLSLSLIVLPLISCAPEPDRTPPPVKKPTAYQPGLDPIDKTFAWSNGQYGFRFNLDPAVKDWVEIYESKPGEITKLDASPYQFGMTIDGHDFREWLQSPKFSQKYPEESETGLKLNNGPYNHFYGNKDNAIVALATSAEGPSLLLQVRPASKTLPKVVVTPPQKSGASLGSPPITSVQFSYDPNPKSTISNGTVQIQEMGTHMDIGSPMGSIAIDGPEEDRHALAGLQYRFNLANTTKPGEVQALGPFGASSARYNGHVFWDADSWWFPALCLTNPKAAANIAEFRLKNLSAAKVAGQAAFHAGGDLGAKYPWESGPNGQELAPSDARNQEHISADVALMLAQASALGIAPKDQSNKAIQEIATYLDHRANKTPQGYTIKNVVSPSEWHTCDDDLYTNVMMGRVFELAGKPQKVVLPRDDTTFLTFTGDKLGTYQQAAALLALFPAQNPDVEKDASKMLARFADKTDPAGPAMSHSINALLYARNNQPQKAYDEWQKSWKLYTDDPYVNFREKPKYGDSYFYTGAAGCLNAVYYGFMGLRLDPYESKNKPWKTPLKNGWWLSADPHLPQAWKSLEIDLQILGKKTTLHADHQGIKVIPGAPR